MQKNLLALLQQQQRSSFSTVPAAASILKRGTTMTEQFLISRLQPFAQLSCSVAFNALSTREKLYTHYLAKACWAGSPIVFEQVSPESPALLKLLNLVFSRNSADEIREISGVDAQEFDDFLVYAACFYGNHGNYLSFGDSKFIPRLGKSGFRKIVEAAAGRMTDAEKKAVLELLDSCLDKVYSLEEKEKMLNFPEMGTSTYYSPNVTKNEIDLVQKFMEEKKISPYNTRLFKTGDNQLEIRIASAVKGKDVPSEHFEGYNISIKFGDHHESLQKVAHYISKAIPYAANENQANMLKAYFDHFTNGPIDLHKNAQRFWIKDVGPVVETNIGFIESYRDPAGVRGEFEGFVAVVNKEVSKKFAALVNNAPKFLQRLPWSSEFEKDRFLRPDFTSLEVVCFSGSGIPAGINIPNYDDIRQDEGFKNVSLGNVLTSYQSNDKVTFLHDDDQKIYSDLRVPSFEVQVGGHELLGHGSGKLLAESENGKFNFSRDLVNPLTNEKVNSWYKPGQQYDSVFGTMASSLEECRAECVGVLLSADLEFLEIFEFSGQKAEDIIYVNWLNMARAGVLALEFYSPEQNKWRQAHMQARFGILRCFLEAANGFVSLDPNSDDPIVRMDRSKIQSIGVPAVRKFLHAIQIYKSTADIDGAKKLYDKYTSVPEEYLNLREIVLKKKKPRALFVQAHTEIVGEDQVELKQFESSAQGMIASYITRFVDSK